jgi:hypothetical protein
MMKTLILLSLLNFSFLALAQKPSLDQSYKFKATPKISLKKLRIPTNAGGHIFLGLDDVGEAREVKKERGPSSAAKSFGAHQQGQISVSGACTLQNGGIVSPGDSGYDSCLDGSVYVKKVILTDPTQSILMNVNLNGLNFNPFE